MIGLMLLLAMGDWRAGSSIYRDADRQTAEAMDACADAVEAEGRERAGVAEVTGFTTLAHVGSRISLVGRVVLRGGPDPKGEKHVFRCRIVHGGFERATIDEAR